MGVKKDTFASALLDGKYELGKLLGCGSFAKVYHARNLQTGKSIAMKIIYKEKMIKGGLVKQIMREISAMKLVKHPNIVELYEVMASKTKIYIVMEFVKGGELCAKVVEGKLEEDVCRVYFQQLISAIGFCHTKGVYHRDIKPENLLLDKDGNLKVTDFGLSTLAENLNRDGLFRTSCGTPAYVAPEVIARKGYDGAKADLWSCGVVLFMLLAGYLPFKDPNLFCLYRKIHRGDFRCPSWFSYGAMEVVTKLLDPDPSSRITVTEIMDLPWFKKTIPRTILTKEERDIDRDDGSCVDKAKEQETLNAFHLISLSQGFNLSALVEEKREDNVELRFAIAKPASSVISKLEEVAEALKFNVKKSEFKVRLQRQERGRKEKLVIMAEIFPMASSLAMVEMRKDNGDTLEFNQFCNKELRPELEDIVWTSSSENLSPSWL